MIRNFLILAFLSLCLAGGLPYEKDTGLEYYYYSNVVFCGDQTIRDWSCQYPCGNTTGMINTRVVFNPKENIKAYVGYQSKSNKIVTSFRGSLDWKNYLLDSTFVQVKYGVCDQCRIHSGFLFGYNSVKAELLKNIAELLQLYPTAELYFTGHSLGGALATVAALEVLHQGYNVKGLYTYGSPRVGNKQYAQFAYQAIQTTYRHVYHNDIVPHLPPTFTGYQHLAQEIWQEADGQNYTLCSSQDGEDAKCSASIPAFKYSNADHTIYFMLDNGCNGGAPHLELQSANTIEE